MKSPSSGRGARVSRRRLLWAGALLAPAALAGGWGAWRWYTRSREQQGSTLKAAEFTHHAALSCLVGDLRSAYDFVAKALALDKRHARAWFLLACIDLERRETQELEATLLRPGLESAPEARLLLALAEHRRQAPDWRHAFFNAWQSLGRPAFNESQLLPEPLSVGTYLFIQGAAPEPLWDKADEPQRRLLAVLDERQLRAHQDWLLEQVRTSTSPPWLMALCERLHLPETAAALREALVPAVRERLVGLAGPSPNSLQLALVPRLVGTSREAPFSREELESLEAVASLPVWSTHSSEQTFTEARGPLKALRHLRPAHHALMLTTWASGLFLKRWLLGRAQASEPRQTLDEQRFLGRMLWQIGTTLARQRSGMEWREGLRLAIHGARSASHQQSFQQATEEFFQAQDWQEQLTRVALERWPLPSLLEELCGLKARDERALMQAFAGQGELP